MLKKTKRKASDRFRAKGLKIAVVVSRFNRTVCQGLLKGCQQALFENGVDSKSVKVLRVAGAFEIPLVAKKLALSKKYAGVVALGCVIRGDTPHFEYISLAATLGCQQASLDSLCPVSCGVLTVNDAGQARERSQPGEYNKGREAALALLDSIHVLTKV